MHMPDIGLTNPLPPERGKSTRERRLYSTRQPGPNHWYAYRVEAGKLNDAYDRIFQDGGQVEQTFHLGGRDFVLAFSKPGNSIPRP
jgi:hypothetical protein